jgi:lysophospholipase L1-like esterase
MGALVLAASAPAARTDEGHHAPVAERVAAAPGTGVAAAPVAERVAVAPNDELEAAPPLPPPDPTSAAAAAPSVASERDRSDVRIGRPVPVGTAQSLAGAKAVFLGDSFTTGWNGAGLGPRGWPALVGRQLGWRTVNLAVAGTGFMNPGWTSQTVGSRVPAAIRQKPDIVFIAAGHNDSRWSAATTARASDMVLDRLHRALPNAVLVIVAPIWPSGSPPMRCLDLRDHLRRRARSLDAIFIDPLADRWFAGSRHRMIGPDGIHPTDAGYRYIAERVLKAIAAAD